MDVYLKGNYNSYFTKLRISRTKHPTNHVLLNIHGLYGQSGDMGSKSRLLCKRLIQKGLTNVVEFSSSRDWRIYDPNARELSKQAFEEKTFQQERQDIIDTIELVIQQSQGLFGIDPEKVILHIVASSLGGTVTSALGDCLEKVRSIVLCGSGTGASSLNKPILSTYPGKDYITNSAATFKGHLLFLQGELDETVPLFSQQELFDAYKNTASKEYKVIEGANHNFSSINGRDKRLAQETYVNLVTEFLAKRILAVE